ncbi:MAG: hypothetical protein Q8R18_01545 [bacterium]|nr:hypothetical protein [bacterium]
MKQKDEGNNQKDTSNSFKPFRSAATEAPVKKDETNNSSLHIISRRDLFLMSFLGFLSGGILILGLLFFTGAITGNISLGLLGEKEVVIEEIANPVIESPVQNVTEVVWNDTEAEVLIEEPVVEEISDPCGPENEIVLLLDETYDHNGRDVILKLAGEFAAQISVGGKKDFIDVGTTVSINSMTLTMLDGNEAGQSATIYIAC